MKKALKISLWTLLALVLLLIIAAVLLVLSFNPNHYKTKISNDFYQATGHPLVIAGDIHWSLSPNLGITLNDVTVKNPAGYTQPSFAQINSIQLSVKLWPLLSKRIEINRMVVNGVALTLVQKNTIENNWNFIPPDNLKLTKPNKNTVTPAAVGQNNPLVLQVGYFEIDNATISYQNLQTQDQAQIKNVVLSASNINLAGSFPVKLAFDLQNSKPAFSAHIGLQGKVQLDAKQQQYAIRQLTMQVNGQWVNGKNKLPLNFDVQGGAVANLQQQQLRMQATINVNSATVLMQLQVDQLQQKNLSYRGDIQLLPIDFDAIIQGFGFAVPKFPSERALSDSTFKVHFSGDRQHVVLDPVTINLNRSKMTGRVELSHFAQPSLNLNLNIDQIPVQDYVHLQGAQLELTGMQLIAKLTSQSLSMPLLVQTLNGQAQLIVKQSTLKGVDLGAMLQNINDTVNTIFQGGNILASLENLNKQIPQFSPAMQINPNNGKQTQFAYFNTQATVTNGVVNNGSINLVGNNFVINGSGTTDLTKHATVNYHFTAANAQMTRQTNGQWTQVPGTLKIPLYVQGPLEALTYGVDMSNLLSQLKDLAIKRIQTQLQQAMGSSSGGSSQAQQGSAPATSANTVQQVQQQAQQLLQNVLH